jgi:hypothetical protein
MADSTVIVVDHGWKKLGEQFEALKRGDAYVKSGILGEAAAKVETEHQTESGTPMTNVQLAVIHEFGAPSVGIPARSFIRAPFEAKRNDYLGDLRKLVRGVYENRVNLRKVLSIMGLKMEWDQKNAVLKGEGIPPPLAPSTIKAKERKGRWNKAASEPPRPLVDSGRMVGAVSHAVVGFGGGGGG